MKILEFNNNLEDILQQIRRVQSKNEDVENTVRKILADVRQNGDNAIFKYNEQFDGLKSKNLKVSLDEVKNAYKRVDNEVVNAIKEAKKNISKFHKNGLVKKEKNVITQEGVELWREFRAIEKIGLYIPGGKAAYPSTVLMLSVPAMIAGCKEVVMCSPADKNGELNPYVLVAADICGIKNIFKVGGAQAIGAMAYGTESISKVYKIFGPGNQYVTTAKMLVHGEVDIDIPAGPSELLIISDIDKNPAWIAADLLSQLEHGEDSQVIFITFSKEFVLQVKNEILIQTEKLSRKNIIKESLKRSFSIIVEDIDQATMITNEYAPEHLEIVSNFELEILAKINNAGSVFLGEYSTEPLGDYATGTNHTLPTSGYAKMFNPLSIESFGKKMQIQKVNKTGITKLRKTVESLADAEGLDAHKNAVTIRFVN